MGPCSSVWNVSSDVKKYGVMGSIEGLSQAGGQSLCHGTPAAWRAGPGWAAAPAVWTPSPCPSALSVLTAVITSRSPGAHAQLLLASETCHVQCLCSVSTDRASLGPAGYMPTALPRPAVKENAALQCWAGGQLWAHCLPQGSSDRSVICAPNGTPALGFGHAHSPRARGVCRGWPLS